MGRKSVLTDRQIKWAWGKVCDGHTKLQIADALYISPKTLNDALRRRYGKTTPEVLNELVYDGGYDD